MITTCAPSPYQPRAQRAMRRRHRSGFGLLGGGCSKAGASPLLVFLESAQIRPIRQRTTRATALEMAAQLPALQWYVWSPRNEDSALLHPGAQRPTARRQRFLFSFLCPHTATLGVSTRDPLAPASEAHAANSEGEDTLAGEGSPVPPWL